MPVTLLRLVEQALCALVVPTGGAYLRHRQEPPVPVLGDRCALTQHPRRLQMRLCAGEIIELPVELCEDHMHVGGGSNVGVTARCDLS